MEEAPKDIKLSDNSSLFLHFVRGIASQLVVIGHALSFYAIVETASLWLELQKFGVVIFFVMSGFIITYSTLFKMKRNANYGFQDFFFERFFRIYVPLVPTLIFVYFVDTYFSGQQNPANTGALDFRTFLGNLLMFQDYANQYRIRDLFEGVLSIKLPFDIVITSFGSARPLWTVAIEWWIYMLFGWLLLGGKMRGKKTPQWFFWLVILAFAPVPLYHWVRSGRGFGLTFLWCLGSLIYILLRSNFKINRKDCLTIAAIFGFLGFQRLLFVKVAYDALFFGLVAVSFFFCLAYFQQTRIVVNKHIEKIIKFHADYSYTLYLVHYTVMTALLNSRGESGWKIMMFSILLSNVIAIVFYFLFERNYKFFKNLVLRQN